MRDSAAPRAEKVRDRIHAGLLVIRDDRDVVRRLRGRVCVDHGYGYASWQWRSRIRPGADDDDAVDLPSEKRIEVVALANRVSAGVAEEDRDLSCAESVLGPHEDRQTESTV